MTDEDITKVSYWIDLLIKAAIGIVVTIVGLDYRSMKETLVELQEKKQALLTDVAILRAALAQTDQRLQRIEAKIDRLVERTK